MNLREYLDEKRITYREFAEKLGIHLQSLKSIVYGVRRPSLEIAVKIEELTNGQVTPKDLIATFNKKSEIKPSRKAIRKWPPKKEEGEL